VSDTPIPGVDPKTGEVLDDEEQVKPFAEMLSIFDNGSAHEQASRGLHDLIDAVQTVGRKGGVTIAIEVSPLKGSADQVVVTAQVTVKLPKQDTTSSMFFVDRKGNLSRQDPRQPVITGLQIAKPIPARVVGVKETS
jgi:hypothetical protein